MGEHLLCKQEVLGSNPFASTNARDVERAGGIGRIGIVVETGFGGRRLTSSVVFVLWHCE